MNLLFISFHNPDSIGVRKKVHQQISFFEKSGVNVKAIFINTNYEKSYSEGVVDYVKLPDFKLPSIYNRRFIRRGNHLAYQYLFTKHQIDTLLESMKGLEFDRIYFRYPLASHALLNFSKKYGKKIIFEHNTKETFELVKEKVKHPVMKYSYWCEKNIARKIFKNVKAGVSVSSDFQNYQNEKAGFSYCKFVYPNPIDVLEIKERVPALEGKYKLFVMIGSYDHWHGLDLLANAIVEKDKVADFEIYYIGKKNDLIARTLKDVNVNFVGTSDEVDINKYFDICDVAIGSLAFHRLSITESSSLKTKEYLAKAMPIVISAPDVCFKESLEEISPYFLHLDNSKEKLNLTELINFIEKIRKDKNHTTAIRAFAEKYVDFRKIFKQMIQEIIN